MSKCKFYATGVWVDTHLAQWFTMIMAMIHFGLAIAVFIGGVDRFSFPSYDPLVDYTRGQVWIWGVWIALSAVLMTTPFRRLNIAGLWIGMMWHVVWMSCFIIAAAHYTSAAATPIPIYGGLAMLNAALLTARVIDKT